MVRKFIPPALLLLLAAAPATRPATIDQQFLLDAHHEALAQLKVATLARDQAQDTHLKELAIRVMAINQKVYDRLRDLDYGRAAVQFTNDLTPQAQQRVKTLESLEGPEFDYAFIKDQIQAHQRLIRLYEKEARDGEDSVVKQFAQNQLPALRDDLAIFQNLTDRMPAKD